MKGVLVIHFSPEVARNVEHIRLIGQRIWELDCDNDTISKICIHDVNARPEQIELPGMKNLESPAVGVAGLPDTGKHR